MSDDKVRLECCNCGHLHYYRDRVRDEESRLLCPNCEEVGSETRRLVPQENTDPEFERGEIVVCTECEEDYEIVEPVIEVFGTKIGFGPEGEEDMITKWDDEVKCNDCLEEEMEVLGVDDANV